MSILRKYAEAFKRIPSSFWLHLKLCIFLSLSALLGALAFEFYRVGAEIALATPNLYWYFRAGVVAVGLSVFIAILVHFADANHS